MQFHVGDTVQLRYGAGPQMTVEKVTTLDGNTWITCVWGHNHECHNYFAAEMLQVLGSKAHAPVSSSKAHDVRSPGVLAALWDRLAFWR
jgi:uncharacterized protein YodC (DUF2158 family)